jgi:hypothetical protein
MLWIFLVLAYLLFVWVGLRLTIPHLGFKKERLPTELPSNFSAEISRLDAEAADDMDFLKRAFEFVTSRYYGSRPKTVFYFWTAFQDPINHAPGFLPCTSLNYLVRVILVKSGRFRDADIQVKVIPLNFFIHQYLKVRVNNTWIDVDPWSAFLGVPLGKKSALFG